MSEARAAFAKVLTRAEQGEAVQVTRGGKPVAVIVSIQAYEQAQSERLSPSEAFRGFMKTLDRRVLSGTDHELLKFSRETRICGSSTKAIVDA